MTTRPNQSAQVLTASGWLACLTLAAAPAAASAAEASAPSLSERRWEEVVVVGSHLPRPAREVGSAVSVLTADEIRARELNLGSELLREVPGVAVSRPGPEGALTQVRIRGAEGNHTLVLIDGIEANDPALGSEFNFADLQTWDIGRVEVLRGPQSALYGSDAIGGVISLSTLEPEPGVALRGELEGGSFGTSQAGLSLAGASERVSGLLSASRYATDGISASAIEPEDDGYRNTTLHGKLSVALSPSVDARLVLRSSDNEVDNDALDFAFPATATQGLVVDALGRTESSQRYGLLELNGRLVEDRWLHRLAYGHTETDSDTYADGARTGASRGERRKLQYETTFRFDSGPLEQALTGGVQHEDLAFENLSAGLPGANQAREDDQTSYIGEYALSYAEVAALSMSVRHDDNERFESATTFRTTASYLVEASGTRLHASYGEGITNPSFFELFGFLPASFVGNPDLQPERAESWDVGVEQSLLGGRALVDVTWFDALLEDEIATVFLPSFQSTPVNQDGRSDRDGVEVTTQAQLSPRWSLRASYTWLDATEPDGADELRRPGHAGSVNLHYRFLNGRGSVNLGALFNGAQEDAEFVDATPRSRVTLDAYTLINLAMTFDVAERVQLFVRGENLLDEDYTQVFGYRSPGAAGYLGLRARL